MGRKSQLTEAQWREIRARSKNESLRSLGKEFGISHVAISRKLKTMGESNNVSVERKKVTTPPELIPPVQHAPRRTAPTVMKRIDQLESAVKLLVADSRIPHKKRQPFETFMQMDPQALEWSQALGLLLDALEQAKEQGTLKFKPRDLRDVEVKLGAEAFKWAWRFCLNTGIIVSETKLSDDLAEQLGVTKTTGGRYVYNYLLLQERE